MILVEFYSTKYIDVMRNFKETQLKLNQELENFSAIIQLVLPKYLTLIAQPTLNQSELIELGEIEYYLLEVNDKLNCLRELIAKHLFGNTIDLYYHQKKTLLKSNKQKTKHQLEKLKVAFEKEIREGGIIIWN